MIDKEIAETRQIPRFQLGRYYQHNSGKKMYIAGIMDSFIYGTCFIAEERDGRFTPISMEKSFDVTQNWFEIDKYEFNK